MTAYELLLNHKATTSRRHFSVRWCGRSPSYLATQHEPSLDALVTVLRRLVAAGRWLLALRVAYKILLGRGQR